jgi:putative redox protein
MALHATAHRIAGTLRHDVVLAGGRHVIYTDEPRDVGGTDTAPSPPELLPASLASSVATTIEMYAARNGWDVGAVIVEVEYQPEASPQCFEVTVHLPDDLTLKQHERLMLVAGKCPVHRALESGFEFAYRMVRTPRKPVRAAA